MPVREGMKRLVVLGAGTAGTIVANRALEELDASWSVTVVDPAPSHLYQPGLVFLPFGAHDEEAMQRPRERTLRRGVRWVREAAARVDPSRREVRLADGSALSYDLLVFATGNELHEELVEGSGAAHDPYTLGGALGLRWALRRFREGQLVVSIASLPVKWPLAAVELALLADAWLRGQDCRERVELTLALPPEGRLAPPEAFRELQDLLASRDVRLALAFAPQRVDREKGQLLARGGARLGFDVLALVPHHTGAGCVTASGLGDDYGFLPVDPRTLAVLGVPHAFALGDAVAGEGMKSGSAAAFQAYGLAENLVRDARGASPLPICDGHVSGFVECGFGRALFLDFNDALEPPRGRYPVAGVGPFRLLGESRVNHLAKLALRGLYWNAVLPGRATLWPRRLGASARRRALPAEV